MKIALYSPFLADNIGGGERYLLTVAECLLARHQVDLVLSPDKVNPGDLNKLKNHFVKGFNLNLKNLHLVLGPFSPQASARQRAAFTKAYDVFYYMTDGSFFVSRAKLNVVHFMIPFRKPPRFFQRLKLASWQVKVANSRFTQKALERIWKIKIDHVHLGAVDPKDFKPLPKKKIILNVGRFFSPRGNKHCKRQDFMVKTFKKMSAAGLTGWRLVFNGPVDPGRDNLNYLKKVKRLALGLPVTFHTQGSFKTLQKNYGQASIYWHATGFGLDQTKTPQAVEHLGLSTVEAMAAGCVPVVIAKGGQPEIVSHTVNGLLWDSQSELIRKTLALIDNHRLWTKLSRQAQKRSRDFSKAKFCRETRKIFQL